MIIALGIIIFIIGCCLSSYEDVSYTSQKRAEARHRELMRVLDECNRERERELAPKEERRARRRIAKDKDGNVLAEEIVEEIIR